jgi:hypothetical protein
MLPVFHQRFELILNAWKVVVVKTTQALQQIVVYAVSHCKKFRRALLHERRVGGVKINALNPRSASDQLKILPQRGDVTLLLQDLQDRAANGVERRRRTCLSSDYFNDMQSETAMHDAGQNANFRVSK